MAMGRTSWHQRDHKIDHKYTPEVSQLAPEKWWLEDDPFLLGFGNFSGANCETLGGVFVGPFCGGSV